jgi:hypothetical protein
MGLPVFPLAVDLAEYVLGTLAPHDLPAVALRALLDGHESLSLSALAGVSTQAYDRWEVEELLSSALRELDVRLPSPAAAAQVIIDDSVRRALSGTMTPAAAVSRIVHGAYYATGASQHDSKVAGDALDVAEIVGIYWMYEELDASWSPSEEELDRDALEALRQLAERRRPTPA